MSVCVSVGVGVGVCEVLSWKIIILGAPWKMDYIGIEVESNRRRGPSWVTHSLSQSIRTCKRRTHPWSFKS